MTSPRASVISQLANPDPRIALLREALETALADIAGSPGWDANRACVILSGGLDSSIAAQLGAGPLGLTAAFTVLATPACTDRPHAAGVASAAGLAHWVADVSLAEVLQELPTCVEVLESFDPMSIRNELAICRALREAATRGFACAVTGDGADELFGGYSFTHRLDPEAWEANRRRMAALMTFGSAPLGARFGVHVASPFLHPAVQAAALGFSRDDCVGAAPPRNVHATPGVLGKLPLRLACPEVVTAWRGKDAIEVGCGTTELGERPWVAEPKAEGYFQRRISDKEFEREAAAAAAEGGVALRDKEHLAYYRAFRAAFPGGAVPGKPRGGSDPCPACHYQLSSPEQTFCVTCGHYDPDLRSGDGTVEAETDAKAG